MPEDAKRPWRSCETGFKVGVGGLGISPDVATVTPAGRRAHATAFAGGATGLAKKQAHARDTQVLLHMAQAWLLVAELAQLHLEDGPSDGQKNLS